MLDPLMLILRHPVLRLVALTVTGLGAINASVYPYQSLIAVQRVGLSERAFAAVLVLAALAGVTAALTAGIVTDRRARRRRVALLTGAVAVAGPLSMWLWPSPATLILCHGLTIPASASLYGQAFALARLACADLTAKRDGIIATLRAILSLAFVTTMLGWTLAFTLGADVMAIYTVATLAALALFALLAAMWPRDGRGTWADTPSGLSLAQALAELAQPAVLIRVGLLGAIAAGPVLYMALAPLIFDATPGRDAADVALYVGMVAGWEVPFMLALSLALRALSRGQVIALGAAVYAAHVVLMPLLAGSALIWAVPVLAGIGGAAILTLPLSYLQDLLSARPGTASALLAVQKVVGDTLAAAAFALGTLAPGYLLAAMIGGAVMVTGAVVLMWIDRARITAS